MPDRPYRPYVIPVGFHPELTPEDALEAVGEHFDDKYEVYPAENISTNGFIVKRSGRVGIRVRLNQEPDATAFALRGLMPSNFLNFMTWNPLGIPWGKIFFGSGWIELQDEVASFIRNAPEFK